MKNDNDNQDKKKNEQEEDSSVNSGQEEIEETEETGEEAVSQEEFDALRDLASQSEDKYKRALADYQNLQKRTQDEKGEWIRSANKELILRILTVLDTLILAYQHTQDKNIQVSVQQFLDILKSEGVTKIETVGQKFDPAIMEAISTDIGEEGKVLEELRVGFMMYDRLLRAAQVKVGKKV
jgi:molecular chaperone GrpE